MPLSVSVSEEAVSDASTGVGRSSLVVSVLSFDVSLTANKRDEVDREWYIEELVMGDGTSAHGRTMEQGEYYASGKLRGGLESFWKIDTGSFKVTVNEGRAFLFPTRGLTKKHKLTGDNNHCKVERYRCTRLQAGGYRKHVITQSLMKFCRKNPGIVVVLGGTGERGAHDLIGLFLKPNKGMLRAYGRRWNCVPAAVINAINARGNETATKTAEKEFHETVQRYTNLGEVPSRVHKLGVGLTIRKPDKEVRGKLNDGKRSFAFRWLTELKRGQWIVRLCQANVVDHCIAIEADRGLILDGEEKHPMLLCRSALRCCGGNEAKKLEVAQIYQIEEA